jgi:hypothetical protein
MKTLTHAFKQLPEGKRIEHVARVRTIGQKYPD